MRKDTGEKCPECGTTIPPLKPMTLQERIAKEWQFIRRSLAAPMMIPAFTGLGWIAVFYDHSGLYILAGLLNIFAMIAVALLAFVFSFSELPQAMMVAWSMRGGRIGPWSGRLAHFMIFMMLFAFQIAIGAIVAGNCLIFAPPYRFE
ncbi:MAG TPA: hypothetical protein VG711_10430 [Phycisphaerales bacterium]|nr:hypothetical protein [Phycisphaerales bacterium]